MDERTSQPAGEDPRFQHPLLAALSAAALDAILVVGPADELLFANQQFYTLWSLPETVAGTRSLAAYRQAIAELLVDPDDFFGEAERLYPHPDEESRDTVRLKDGRILDRHSRPVIDADGARHGRVWFYRDITSQWRLSEGLRQSEASLAIAQRIAGLGSWSWDIPTNTVTWSDETFRIFGFDPHAVVPTYDLFMSHIQPADRERVDAALAAALAAGAPYDIELGICLPDGASRTLHARGELARDEDGRPRRMTGTVLDISERVRAEEALRESEERLRDASESGFDALQVLRAIRDERGAIVDFAFVHLNRQAEAFLRVDRDEMIGQRVSARFPEYVTTGYFAKYVQVTETGATLEEEIADDTPGFEGSWIYQQIAPVGDGVAITAREITDRKRAEEALRASEERFRNAFDGAAVGVVMRDLDGRLLRANDRLCEMLGHDEQSIFSAPFAQLRPETDAPGETELRHQLLVGEIDAFRVEKQVEHRDGHFVTLAIHASLLTDNAGRPVEYVAQILDITEQRRAEQALRESEERFRRSFADAAIGMALVGPDGSWLQVNPALCRMIGYREDELLALTFQDVTHPDDLDADLEQVRALLAGTLQTYGMEKRYFHRDGHVIWAQLNVSLVCDSAGAPLHFVSQVQDITERKALQEQLRHQAFHDSLTGLPNRAYFTEQVERALARVQRGRTRLALLFLDLDGFKLVNDTHGHAAGDALLASVAERLQASVRPSDIVARLGGDEFTILLEDIEQPADITSAATRIIAEVNRPYTIDDQLVTVSTSVGIALPAPGVTADTLLRQADDALYRAKTTGKGGYAIHGATSQ